MSRSGKDRDTRVRTSKKRTASSTRWLQRQLNDPYVKQAKAEGYRSRAAYKLIELDEKFGLLKGITRVVDLGIAPGGWSQVVRKLKPKAHVVGIDLLEVDIPGSHCQVAQRLRPPKALPLHGNILSPRAQDASTQCRTSSHGYTRGDRTLSD